MPPQQQQQQQQAPQQQGPPVLSAAALASASPEVRKNLIGERLYPLVASSEPALAGKVTGMLLDGMEVAELLHLIESPEMLQLKIREAIEVLERWRRPLAPDGRLSLAVPDWEYCRRRAVDDPDGAFSALFAHGSRRAPRWGWRASDLERSLEEAGFASVDVRPFGAELRVHAWPRACAHEQESDREGDLLVAWPHYEETELTLLLETVFATRPPGLRLVLRHDPTRDGLEAGAVATLKRAARNLGCGLGSDGLEVDLVSGSWAHLCPFEIGERTLLSIVTDPADPDRRRFIASLGAPSARLTEFESGLSDRRAAS